MKHVTDGAGSQRFVALPLDYSGIVSPDLVVTHFTFPSLSAVRAGNTVDVTNDWPVMYLEFNSGVTYLNARLNPSLSAISFNVNGSAISATLPLTSSIFDYATENTVFTLAYDFTTSKSNVYLGFYAPITTPKSKVIDLMSATAKSVGRVFSITGTYEHGIASKFYSVHIDHYRVHTHTTLGVKTYNGTLSTQAISAMTMNHNNILYNSTTPTHY